MPVQNTDIAEIFNRVADLLDIEEGNPFRIRAYRNAARTVSSLAQSVSDMVKAEKDLTVIPGFGKDLAARLKEIVETGGLSLLKELEGRTPLDLVKLTRFAGLGPKRVKTLYHQLGITTLQELKDAAEKGKIQEIRGFGEKTEQAILEGLKSAQTTEKRFKLPEAEQRAKALVEYLKQIPGIKQVTVAGSFRRRKETVGDLDVLVTCRKGSKVIDRFVAFEDVTKVISKGGTRSTVLLRPNLQVDLRVLPEASYGAALQYFTGSKAHNIGIRKLGVERKLKINEYGVFRGEKRIAGRTEEEVYRQVDLPYIEPELRESQGEIKAAQEGRLPQLVRVEDIRGDLHVHTSETDGRATLEEMVKAAQDRGYEYVAVTDHSRRVAMVHGFDAKRLAEQIKEIDRLNGRLKHIVILKSVELDILEDGSPDLPDDILKDLDLTVFSIHYNRRLSRTKQTERVLRAMDNPHLNIFAHPTGQLIDEREPYEIDLERIMLGARERGCLMELNAHPDRFDLSDKYCKMAKELGIKVAISTDAHGVPDFDFMRFGVDQARRGWLEPGDVANTGTWPELKTLLKRR